MGTVGWHRRFSAKDAAILIPRFRKIVGVAEQQEATRFVAAKDLLPLRVTDDSAFIPLGDSRIDRAESSVPPQLVTEALLAQQKRRTRFDRIRR